MLFPGYYYSIKINFFKHETGKISRFQPAACGVFNRKLIEFSTGNLCSFQPAICRVFNRQFVEFSTGNLWIIKKKQTEKLGEKR